MIVGDSGVGKTEILNALDRKKPNNSSPTIASDIKIKVLEVEGKKVKAKLWDTAGQERYRSLSPIYFRDTEGIILVYDVSDSRSFKGLSKNSVIQVNGFYKSSKAHPKISKSS